MCVIQNLKRMLLLRKPGNFFFVLSDFSSIPDVRTLLLLKKASTRKTIFKKGKKRQQFFQCSARAQLAPLNYATNSFAKTVKIFCLLATLAKKHHQRCLKMFQIRLCLLLKNPVRHSLKKSPEAATQRCS